MRLPRKRKKEVKKIVAVKTAYKMVMTAMVTAQSTAQVAMIAATPTLNVIPAVSAAQKGLKVAEVLVRIEKYIKQILSEKPNHWRDFVKT